MYSTAFDLVCEVGHGCQPSTDAADLFDVGRDDGDGVGATGYGLGRQFYGDLCMSLIEAGVAAGGGFAESCTIGVDHHDR